MERLPGAVLIEGVSPFAETLRQCFVMGIEAKAKHLICVDADVLPDYDLIHVCTQALNDHPKCGAVVPKMWDWLQGRVRSVGVHAYHGDKLRKALNLWPHYKDLARPESTLRREFGRAYKPRRQMGIHGRHQYYRDIYRTGLLWAYKHQGHESMLLEYWKSQGDPDFRVLERAWKDGKRRKVSTADASIEFDIDAILASLGLTEKGPYEVCDDEF